MVNDSQRTAGRLEGAATLLLALAAVVTAWASYQATRWNGEQVKASSRTNALRIDAARAASLAESQTQVDIATFIQWVDATANQDQDLAQFYVERFRPEFVPAFDAWLASAPLTNPEAPRTPFANPDYRLAVQAETKELDRASERSAAVVSRNVQRAADYVLAVVLFAAALFFAGISTKLERTRLRLIILGVGGALFVGTAVWLATLPVLLSV